MQKKRRSKPFLSQLDPGVHRARHPAHDLRFNIVHSQISVVPQVLSLPLSNFWKSREKSNIKYISDGLAEKVEERGGGGGGGGGHSGLFSYSKHFVGGNLEEEIIALFLERCLKRSLQT